MCPFLVSRKFFVCVVVLLGVGDVGDVGNVGYVGDMGDDMYVCILFPVF